MSSALASGGGSRSAGSPVKWRIRKTTKETPSSTRPDCHPRRTRYDVIERGATWRSRLFRDGPLGGLVEARDGLDVGRVGKHVDRLHPSETIAASDEIPNVPGERRRIARDVDNARRRELD